MSDQPNPAQEPAQEPEKNATRRRVVVEVIRTVVRTVDVPADMPLAQVRARAEREFPLNPLGAKDSVQSFAVPALEGVQAELWWGPRPGEGAP